MIKIFVRRTALVFLVLVLPLEMANFTRNPEISGVLAPCLYPFNTWVPMATVHFAAMTVAVLAGWMAVRVEIVTSTCRLV